MVEAGSEAGSGLGYGHFRVWPHSLGKVIVARISSGESKLHLIPFLQLSLHLFSGASVVTQTKGL